MQEDILEQRIAAANQNAIVDETITEEVTEEPTDYYRSAKRERSSADRKRSYGSRPYAKKILGRLQNSPVKFGYQKAKDDIEYLKSVGDKQRAEMVRQQYMEDYYMPAVDAAIRLGSKADVLGSQDILDMLDSLVIVDGVRPNGYTASFVANLYEDGNAPSQSDIDVVEAVQKITRLCNEGNISSAIGTAKRIKERIDSGNSVAIPEDYEIIQKVAIRG